MTDPIYPGRRRTINNDRRKSKQKMMMSPRVGLVTITKVVDKYLLAATGRKNAEPKIDHSYHVFFQGVHYPEEGIKPPANAKYLN